MRKLMFAPICLALLTTGCFDVPSEVKVRAELSPEDRAALEKAAKNLDPLKTGEWLKRLDEKDVQIAAKDAQIAALEAKLKSSHQIAGAWVFEASAFGPASIEVVDDSPTEAKLKIVDENGRVATGVFHKNAGRIDVEEWGCRGTLIFEDVIVWQNGKAVKGSPWWCRPTTGPGHYPTR